MGFFTLEDFREELSSVLGQRGTGDRRLDRWINFGYLDLTGALDFDELNDLYELNVTASQNTYDVPAKTRMVKAVVNEDTDRLLDYVDPTEFFRLDRTKTAEPLRWTRYADNILLHPTPADSATFTVMRKVDPDRLEEYDDVTVLSDTWDAAIHMLSVYHGFLALAENEARANAWMTRAIMYIQTRATQEEMFVKESGLGLSYAMPLEKRLAAMSGMVGNQPV